MRGDLPALLSLKDDLTADKAKQQQEHADELERQRRLEETLALGERQFLSGKLNAPEGDNALDSFRQALEIDPENVRARSGLDRISANHLANARRLQQEGSLAEALLALQVAEGVDPDAPELVVLNKELRQALAERQRQEAIREQARIAAETRLAGIRQGLAKAADQENAGNILEPAGDNALRSYRQVLALDPDNTDAQAGISRLIDAQRLLIQGYRQAGRLEDALAAAQSGLKAWPGTESLTNLSDELAADLDRRAAQAELAARARLAAEQRQAAIDALLSRAAKQLDAGRLGGAGNDNALVSYREALSLDAGNREARLGVARVAEAYRNRASDALQRGDFNAGLEDVQAGLNAVPADGGLLSLRRQLVSAQHEQDRREAEKAARLGEIATGLSEATRLRAVDPVAAVGAYRKVLSVDSGNVEAQLALAEIADDELGKARDLAAAGRWDSAAESIDTGLRAQADNQDLLALRLEIDAGRKEQDQALRSQARLDRQVRVLLTLADEQLRGGRLSMPEGDNALLNYREVLALQANNETALRGVSGVVRQLMDPARHNTTIRELDAGLALLSDAGKTVGPESPAAVLYAKLANQLRDYANDYGQIAGLMEKAEQQFNAGRLTLPPGDNAEESYRQVLALDPDNPRAKDGLQKLLERAKLELAAKMKAMREAKRRLDADEEALRLSIQRELSEQRTASDRP